MAFQPPAPARSLIAAATFAGCLTVIAGLALAAQADPKPGPAADGRTLTILLDASPEPQLAPRPPMQVLPADAPSAFNLARYRQEVAALRAQAIADAERLAEAERVELLPEPLIGFDEAQEYAPRGYPMMTTEGDAYIR